MLDGQSNLPPVNCLRPLCLIFALGFFPGNSHAGALRVNGIPSKQAIIVQVISNPEPVAKLPPPIAPAADASATSLRPSQPAPSPVPAPKAGPASNKIKLIAERERLNRNAVAWQKERAAGGSATAMRSLGVRHMTGDGVEKDVAKGADLLRKAAEGGDAVAVKELAKIDSGKKE